MSADRRSEEEVHLEPHGSGYAAQGRQFYVWDEDPERARELALLLASASRRALVLGVRIGRWTR